MTDDSPNIPGQRNTRATTPDEPIAALKDIEAWQARDRYPELRGFSGPVFGIATELAEGGWQLCRHLGHPDPQSSRDSMALMFRQRAAAAEAAGEASAQREFLAAAKRLDWEVVDELAVLGRRYRVVRAELFIRSGADGPEPPRPTDPDPHPVGHAFGDDDGLDGLPLDPGAPTELCEGVLKLQLLRLVRPARSLAPGAVRDAEAARRDHPDGVLLPTAFSIAEQSTFGWRPEPAVLCRTPQAARDFLSMDLRVMSPVMRGLDAAERAVYAEAADLLDDTRCDEVEVAGRLLRVIRVERLLRMGPDGPEGPRPSDRSQEPPLKVHDHQLRERGLVDADGYPTELPLPISPAAKELARLFEEALALRAERDAKHGRQGGHRKRRH
ncbi:PE-PGRS family protein [Kitasatospora acidiphila]|uniref:PE-PGRS family protein n=1 Tax=Kitasatospora acidiphila TaxID=2567942 RepID=A0A540VWT8_9ACTN|nr:DUF5954 family protein [Kitasatospora acidiphila]TQF01232.1 PE-PGRS family protein [Kitasatospora acidiphila]